MARRAAFRWITLSAAFTLVGCATVSSLAPPVTPGLAASAGTPEAQLQRGRDLYATRCAACHALDPLVRHTPEAWRAIVADMADEAELTSTEQASVLAYVLAARRSLTAGASP